MIYRNDDRSADNAYDNYMTGDDGGTVCGHCDICGEAIYRREIYYFNGDMLLCSGCWEEFRPMED